VIWITPALKIVSGGQKAAANTDECALHKESRPLQQPLRSWSEAVLTVFGVQQGDPLNGASVRFRFGLLGGRIVKPLRPFEAEVAYRIQLNEDRNAQTIRCVDQKRLRWPCQL
jgi:hypothetical protein